MRTKERRVVIHRRAKLRLDLGLDALELHDMALRLRSLRRRFAILCPKLFRIPIKERTGVTSGVEGLRVALSGGDELVPFFEDIDVPRGEILVG